MKKQESNTGLIEAFKKLIIIALVLISFPNVNGNTTSLPDKEKKDKKLCYQGHKIHYEIRGNSEKILVFIHGWSSSIEAWKYQLNEFPEYKVIAIDLPGHGKSSKSLNLNYSIDLYANSVKEVLKSEGISRAFLLGHSMGFAIAEVVNYKYPEICAGIGSIDGAHFEIPEDEPGRKSWIEFNNYMAMAMDEEKGREDFINSLFLEETPNKLKDEVLLASKNVPLPIAKSVILSVTENLNFWQKRTVDIPCFTIHSLVYNLPEDYKDDFLRMYPQAEYHTIENVSHFLMLEVPYRVNQIIDDFLRKAYK